MSKIASKLRAWWVAKSSLLIAENENSIVLIIIETNRLGFHHNHDITVAKSEFIDRIKDIHFLPNELHELHKLYS
jgi:hypothetical protein